MFQSCFEAGDILLDLLDVGEVIAQRFESRIRRQLVLVTENLGARGNQHGVDAVGLGALEMELAEGFDLSRLQQRDGDAVVTEVSRDATFVSAGRLHPDAFDAGGRKHGRQCLPAVNLQMVRDWVPRFNAEGPAGLIDRKAPGQPPRLTDAHRAALAVTIEAGLVAVSIYAGAMMP
ncbi:hypothetical protein DOO78_26075 [Roseicella frigidaeris]|uniref:Uncharacterized protein n=2 Tax=Roseicella frigidaeris TaxID=2230885 RepID=A0A327LWK8_9PROT|nr:hypothetical protein DOO78_26075 [Roseicella frigidaeris]